MHGLSIPANPVHNYANLFLLSGNERIKIKTNEVPSAMRQEIKVEKGKNSL